jgi:hypothetical protein
MGRPITRTLSINESRQANCLANNFTKYKPAWLNVTLFTVNVVAALGVAAAVKSQLNVVELM